MAKDTEKQERAIVLIGGESGAGKSFFVANLKNALIFDTDIGGGLTYADERIKRNKSERIQVNSYLEVQEELTKRHRNGQLADKFHVAFDHLTTLHQEAVLRHNPSGERDYGAANERASKEWRKLRETIRKMDFNIFATAHMKSKWVQEKVVGSTAEAAKNIEADFEIVLYLSKVGNRPTEKTPSLAMVQKWRRDPDDKRGPVPDSFPFTMENFIKIHGRDLGQQREQVVFASPEQVRELTELLKVVVLPDGLVEKWKKAAKVDDWSEMTGDIIQKCINRCGEIVETAKKGS